MPKLTFDVPITAALWTTALADICAAHGWTAQIQDENGNMKPNPVTQAQFFDTVTKKFWKESARAIRVQRAQQQAAKDAATNTDTELNF